MGALDGKTALVTGGTTGLGRAIAERFLFEGAGVVITGRDETLGGSAEEALRSVGDVRFIAADAADADAVARSVTEAIDYLGRLDVLVNNAGIGVAARLLDTPTEDFDRVMSVNVRGYFLYAKAVYEHLRERKGSMVHVASDAAVLGEHDVGVYSVSKSAVIMLSNMLACDGGPDGVRSNCVCPGDIRPGMRHMAPPGQSDGQENEDEWFFPPLMRLGEAEDVASAALFFASDLASFCNGSTLLVDGGMRAGYSTATPQDAPGR
jgi:NAD(P)-dependent dehydrogenase (short-subunit alcohol dehydrogenase family)